MSQSDNCASEQSPRQVVTVIQSFICVYMSLGNGGEYGNHYLCSLLQMISPTISCQGSSVSIVSDYGLDDRAIGIRYPAGAKDFSSILCVQTGSGAHPASYPMGTGDKARPGRDADHSSPYSAEVVTE
jgi:hypothetical protein